MSFFPHDSLHVEILGDQAGPNYRVRYVVKCEICQAFMPLLRSIFVSSLRGAYCKECLGMS